MAQKGIIRNTQTADVGAPELASIFQSMIGKSGIMKVYSNLSATKVNDNTVQLAAGVYNLSGYLLEVSKGTTQNIAIDSGTSGQNRNDIIAAEFVRNGGGTGIDTLQFRVVKGASTTGTAADPALTQQDINGTGVTRQEALYRVKLSGTVITAVEIVADILETIQALDDAVVTKTDLASNALGKGASTVGIQDPTGKITATTVEKALEEIATNVSLLQNDAAKGNVKYITAPASVQYLIPMPLLTTKLIAVSVNTEENGFVVLLSRFGVGPFVKTVIRDTNSGFQILSNADGSNAYIVNNNFTWRGIAISGSA